jgi:hypothetical protein
MSIGRTILALLIALSVAMLPAAVGSGLGIKSADMTEMSSMEDMDCCPHKANPCDQMDGCTSMAACALHCFSFLGSASLPFAYPLALANRMPVLQDGNIHSQTSSPPFRPPRV